MNVHQKEPIITEKILFNKNYIMVSFIMAFLIIVGDVFLLFYLNLDVKSSLLVSAVLVIVYSAFLFFLLEPRLLKTIEQVEVRTFEIPVMKEVIVEKPVTKEVFVDKPVFKTITERVYVTAPRQKLDIPKYNYMGSSERKVYHKRNCRLSKLIKRKYKVSNDSEAYFKRKGFRGCKICMKK